MQEEGGQQWIGPLGHAINSLGPLLKSPALELGYQRHLLYQKSLTSTV